MRKTTTPRNDDQQVTRDAQEFGYGNMQAEIAASHPEGDDRHGQANKSRW